MRTLVVATLVASSTFVFAGASEAQSIPGRRSQFPSRFSVGGDLVMAQPKGEFAENIDRGWGGNANVTYALDSKGFFRLRADGGIVQYGSETKRIPLNPITGRVSLEVTTSNIIGWGSLGGQLQIPDGPFRPYVNAGIAYTDFSTESTLSGLDDNSDGLSSQNQHDGTHAWVTGAGVFIPFGREFNRGGLNFGARYFQGGHAAYLKKGDIIDNPDGSISFTPRRSGTDMIVWQLGVALTLPRT